MKLLIIGVGNPILRDDGVGVIAVRELEKAKARYLNSLAEDTQVVFKEASLGGLGLMEAMLGFDAVILIDAILSDQPPGSVRVLTPESFNSALHASSPHDVSIIEGLRIGREYTRELPENENIVFVTVEAQNVTEFGEELTPAVKDAIPVVCRTVEKIALEMEKRFLAGRKHNSYKEGANPPTPNTGGIP